jgi:hypothetical protein
VRNLVFKRIGVFGALALSMIGCRAPRATMPSSDVLRYGVSHMSGSISFVVHTDGTAEYHASRPGKAPISVVGKVDAASLSALAALLRENDFCGLTSSRSRGVPDEAHPGIEVRLGGLDCDVTLWDDEFRDSPRAKASLDAVEKIGALLEKGAVGPDATGAPAPAGGP